MPQSAFFPLREHGMMENDKKEETSRKKKRKKRWESHSNENNDLNLTTKTV